MKLKVLVTLATSIITASMLFTTVQSASAAEVKEYKTASVGNYVRSEPYGDIIGSIAGNEPIEVASVVTAYDGSNWAYIGGGYICLDYCKPVSNEEVSQNVTNSNEMIDYSYTNSYTGFLNSNQQYIYSHFENQGMPSESAIAIASNTFDESGCNTYAYCIDTNGLPSYGICQWNGERYNNLVTWCSNNGYDHTSLDGQLAFLDFELNNQYSNILEQLMIGGTPWDMSYIWASEFEVCASRYWDTRAENADKLYNSVISE